MRPSYTLWKFVHDAPQQLIQITHTHPFYRQKLNVFEILDKQNVKRCERTVLGFDTNKEQVTITRKGK